MRAPKRTYSVPDSIGWDSISDGKYEDFLSGCQLTFEITTQSDFDGCDAPIA